ncbi:23S rRNA (adenine(2503)-C(2))-methyltransferase RlmN [Verrucomicrobia bacterium LW23]|nr:23S rRNA (adenine(2503)-C(2))-methyltransferase RlmN [Verrucomicrobia bacterium LW23]
MLDSTSAEWELDGVARYRRDQISQWIFARRAASFGEMTDLPAGLRETLDTNYELRAISLVHVQGSRDTTRKLLWSLRGGDYVESVLIPASPDLYGERADRFTLCISTQVGCAYGCRFCASGLEGFKRNLSAGEIVAQIMETERVTGEKINNLVFMGMGEPLANYKNLMRAMDIINAPKGLNIGARHITVSTSGLAPVIRKLAEDPRQIRLALSLHGATDEVRDRIMPVNKKYPLAELLDACAYHSDRKKKMMTFEYILINGVNDGLDQAAMLARHATRIHAKVNLIPYNKVEGMDWVRPSMKRIHAFAARVREGGAVATVRLEKGHDIDAACGQLRLRRVREDAAGDPKVVAPAEGAEPRSA